VARWSRHVARQARNLQRQKEMNARDEPFLLRQSGKDERPVRQVYFMDTRPFEQELTEATEKW